MQGQPDAQRDQDARGEDDAKKNHGDGHHPADISASVRSNVSCAFCSRCRILTDNRSMAPMASAWLASMVLRKSLKKKFPAQPFLIVRYGDHQPEFSPHLLDPGLGEAGVGKKLENYDPRYYATYYAIDAINFEPVQSPAVMDHHRRALSAVGDPEAAGIPLDPSFEEQKSIMSAAARPVLCLQGRCGSAALQQALDRRRFS